MRTAEWITAAGLMLLSAWLMWHATIMPIGWVPGAGPGGGAFPFWLSAIMFVCASLLFLREFGTWRRRGNGGAFFLQHSWRRLLTVALALAVTVALIHVVGVYGAVIAFLIFFVGILGHHGWRLTAVLTVATPIFLFFLFEVTFKILLPKGLTEPLFFPLYAAFF